MSVLVSLFFKYIILYFFDFFKQNLRLSRLWKNFILIIPYKMAFLVLFIDDFLKISLKKQKTGQ